MTKATRTSPMHNSHYDGGSAAEAAMIPPPPSSAAEKMYDVMRSPGVTKRRTRTFNSSLSSAAVETATRILMLSGLFLMCLQQQFKAVQAWGNNNNNNNGETTYSLYGNGFTRDWLYDSTSIAFKVEGCAWGLVEDSEQVGCLQDESEDGTTNWYMMANCRRPQVIYSVYASSSGSASCNDNNFVGSVRNAHAQNRMKKCAYHQ